MPCCPSRKLQLCERTVSTPLAAVLGGLPTSIQGSSPPLLPGSEAELRLLERAGAAPFSPLGLPALPQRMPNMHLTLT